MLFLSMKEGISLFLTSLIMYTTLVCNDLGIAFLHFELACRALGLSGEWAEDSRGRKLSASLEYFMTWSTGK